MEPKRRVISAAPYRDRVVHHALVKILGLAFDNPVHFAFGEASRVGSWREPAPTDLLGRRFQP